MRSDQSLDANRRLLFRVAGGAIVSGAALAAFAGRGAFSRSQMTSNHESAPTQFQDLGDAAAQFLAAA